MSSNRSQIIESRHKILNIPPKQAYAWSDSVVVLSWLRGNPQRLKMFVGNRVPEMLELTPPTCWDHVSSEDNPADCASRGLFPSELAQYPSCKKGPGWLHTPQSDWPLTPELADEPEPEEKRKYCWKYQWCPSQLTCPFYNRHLPSIDLGRSWHGYFVSFTIAVPTKTSELYARAH